ncbi:MAG: conserved hypothetical protein [Methanobrevibacter sp. CfCl-M3]
MSKGIVYILTNPCLDGWVKIGMTEKDDIKERLSQLNSPANIPLSFRAFALYYVDNPSEVEEHIHTIIDAADESLHAREITASGKPREREFFQMSPEKAYIIFKSIAKLRNDFDNLELVEGTDEEQTEEKIVKKVRTAFTFKDLNIPIGTQLSFIRDDSLTCVVVDENNSVEYEGEKTTLSGLARKLLHEKFGWGKNSTAQGPKFFTFNDETLHDRRMHIESKINDGDEEVE